MPIQSLVSAEGELQVACLEQLSADADETASVVTVLGAHGLRQTELLDQIFETSFYDDQPCHGIAAAFVEGEDSAVMAEARHHILLLNVEPFDGPQREREEPRERAAHLAVALSDVIMFVIRLPDLPRVETNGIAALRSDLTEMLLLQADDVVPTPSGKRGFVVVVRDYEDQVLSRQDLISGFLQEMQNVYNLVAKPPRSPPRITELFEFEFILLPSEGHQPEKFSEQTDALRSVFLDPAADDYLFEGSSYVRDRSVNLTECAEKVWNKLNSEQLQDMPDSRELMSTFDCDNAMRKIFEKYQRGVRVWRRETDGGVILENFGIEATDMVEKTMAVYDQDAAPHRGTKAFKRKRDELKNLLDADLYGLFVNQIAKLREVTYRLFKDKLDATEDSEPRLDRTVNNALKESQKYFQVKAEALRPRFSSWHLDNDTKELAAQMREDATERLQRARLADYQENSSRRGRRRRPGAAVGSTGKPRQPVHVSFHYLDPAPFGWKDSRYEKLSVDDDLQYSALGAGGGGGGGRTGGLSMPLAPGRDSSWYQKNQDFIYTERK